MSDHRPQWGQIHIPHRYLHAMHLVASLSALVVVAAIIVEQRFDWFQHRPGGEAFDLNEQPLFMILFVLGALLAVRWQLLGGTLATFTAAGLVVFAYHQFRLLDALIVFLGFLVPGLLWLVVGLFELRDEQFHRTPSEHPRPLLRRRDVLGGLAVIAIAATGGVRISQWLFDRIYGPTHPASRAVAVRGSSTRWLWSGAITTTSAAVTTRLVDDDEGPVQLLVSTSPILDGARAIEGSSNDHGFVHIDIDDLEPDTRYHYAFVVKGLIDAARIGTFRTHPEGPASFDLVVASCARTGSNGRVYDTIRELRPHMVIIDGDLHYADIAENDNQAFRQILDHTLTRPGPAALFAECPVAYVWDDHDFGGNDRTTDARPAAMAAYRTFVPHYQLASADSSVHQAFTLGRVRVLMTDARSARDTGDEDDAVMPTMLGAEQKAWLLDELLAARDTHAMTIWVNPVPWISSIEQPEETDGWGGFVVEREEIADFIADNDIAPRLLMASGDAHMLAIDDGTNSDYSRRGGAGFPVLHAAALDRQGSIKGGPYSHGTFPGGGQFGVISVTDRGAEIDVTLSGRTWRNVELVTHSFTVR